MVSRFKLSDAFEEILQLMLEQKVSFEELDAILIHPESSNRIVPLFSALSTYFSFVEESEEGAVVINQKGEILYINKTISKWFGEHYNEILKQSIFEYFPEPIINLIQQFLGDSESKYLKTEAILLSKDHQKKSVLLSLNKLSMDNKKYCTILITDLSPHKTLEYLSENNELLLAVLENSDDILIITDMNGQVLRGSKNFSEFVGKQAQPLHISDCLELTDYNSGQPISIQELRNSKKSFSKRKVYIHWNSGKQTIANISFAILKNASGEEIGCLWTISDITAVQKAFELNQSILNTMLDGYLLADEKGHILDVNPSYCRLTGYSREELLDMTIFDLEAAMSREEVESKIRAMVQQGSARFTTRHRRKFGGEVTLDVSITVGREEDRILVAAFCKDITEQEALEKILKESESRYRGLFQGSPIPIAIIRDEKIWLINNAGMKVLRETNPACYSYRTIWDLIHPDYHFIAKERLNLLLTGKKEILPPEVYKLIRFDKTTFDAEIVSSRVLFKGRPAIQIVFVDISEKRKLEQIKEMLASISTGIYSFLSIRDIGKILEDSLKKIMPTDGVILGVVKKSHRVQIQYSSRDEGFEEYEIKDSLTELAFRNKRIVRLSEDDINKMKEKNINIFKGRGTRSWMGVPLMDQDHPIGILILQNYVSNYEYTEEDENLLRIVSEQLSIAIREKLRFEELKRFKYMIDNNPISVIITDTDGDIEYVNNFFCEVSGYEHEEVLGKNPRFLKSGHTPKERYEELWQTITSGGTWVGEFVNKKKNGDIFYERAIVSPVKDEEGNIIHYIALKEDITEKKKLELQLMQSQKMEALGQLVGGVAHDFNNLLTAINGYAEYCMMKIDSKHPLFKAISTIHDAGKSAAELTNQLLAFSRKQQYNPQKIEVVSTLESWKKIFRRLIPEDIHLEFGFQKKIATIYADPLQLEQVLLNLIVNARDAIIENKKTEKKQITVEFDEIQVDEVFKLVHPQLKLGRYVVISVSDTGVGIAPEIRDRIFEPFFTTKERGQGTGLGLSTIYGIVTQNEGGITFYSEVGKGTTFKIYWPVFSGTEKVEKSEPQMVELKTRKKILIIEDDKNVRNLIVSILVEHNMDVEEFDSAKAALKFFRKHASKMDLVLSDIVMPEMSGLELVEQLKSLRPDIKIILMSGYSDQHVKKINDLIRDYCYLQKPFSFITLLQKIKEALETPENHTS